MHNNEILSELKRLNASIERLVKGIVGILNDGETVLPQDYRAYRIEVRGAGLKVTGIDNITRTRLSELVGIDNVINTVKRNTRQFLKGYPAHDLLIYGPRGTGKSSCVRALLNEFEELRMIEVEKKALLFLHEIQALVRREPHRFILFCDDLSFHDAEDERLRLKTLLEGGIEERPGNMIIYATSNRRHLVPEKQNENIPQQDEELHPSDALEEKISLSDRFGLRLGIGVFTPELYIDIVKHYMKLRGLGEADEGVIRDAMNWAMAHGNFSGRTAEYFVRDLIGRRLIEDPSKPA
ncbi:MAG: ATP-binding protein [Nitrospirae bacterium]|nr:MAG: ATP-binding protein [Nitrospirota bacterium]